LVLVVLVVNGLQRKKVRPALHHILEHQLLPLVVVEEEVILDIILEILVDLLEEVVFVVMVVHHPLLLSHQQLELHSQELLEQLHPLDGDIKVVLEVEILDFAKVAEEVVLAVLVLLVLIVLLIMVKVVSVYKCQQHLEIHQHH
jgi:hypothetical protein